MKRTLIGAFALLTAACLNTIGGQIEGYFFPVTSLGQVTRAEPVGETRTRIWGVGERLRDCSFNQLIWYLGDASHNARADLVFEEGTKVRDGGEFVFGPWVVQLTPAQLKNRSFAYVYHRCHPLWLTRTRFFH